MEIKYVNYIDFLEIFEQEITLQSMLELYEKQTGIKMIIIDEGYEDIIE